MVTIVTIFSLLNTQCPKQIPHLSIIREFMEACAAVQPRESPLGLCKFCSSVPRLSCSGLRCQS